MIKKAFLIYLSFILFVFIMGPGNSYAADGSREDPVPLTIDVPYVSSVSGGASLYTKYFYFRTNAPDRYTISITNADSDLGFWLYEDQFLTPTDSCNETYGLGDEACIYDLMGDSYYYLMVNNWDYGPATFTITVREITSEGTPTPVPLVIGVTHSGSVDGNSASYYTFIPPTTSAHTFAISDLLSQYAFPSPLDLNVYSGSDFETGLMRSCYVHDDTQCTVNGLMSGVPYYIKVSTTWADDTIYKLAVREGVSEGSVTDPVLLTVGQAHQGIVDAGSNQYYQGCNNPSGSYYAFTTDDAGGYTILTDNDVSQSLRVVFYTDFSSPELSSCTSYLDAPHRCMYSNLEPGTTYYVEIRSCNDAVTNYGISVIREGSEGSVNNPVPLSLETPHEGNIGNYGTSSYYAFRTDSSGTYDIDFINTQGLQWILYSDPAFSLWFKECYNYVSTVDLSCTTPNLDADTIYYLRVDSRGSGGPYTVTVNHGLSEGSINTPIQLTVGTTYHGTVGYQKRSYYTFTTGPAANYYIAFKNDTDIWFFPYSGSDFSSGSFTPCDGYGINPSCTIDDLEADTPYYISVHERGDVDSTYDITILTLDANAGCSADAVECIDFDNGIPPTFSIFTTMTKGNKKRALWHLDETDNASAGGLASLRTGTIPQHEFTCAEYVRTEDTNTMLFSVKTDTNYWSTLNFYIDDVLQPGGTWRGTTAWRREIFYPTPGPHTYTWCYTKETSTIEGADATWIDDIEFK